jgi:hypothetical protein
MCERGRDVALGPGRRRDNRHFHREGIAFELAEVVGVGHKEGIEALTEFREWTGRVM